MFILRAFLLGSLFVCSTIFFFVSYNAHAEDMPAPESTQSHCQKILSRYRQILLEAPNLDADAIREIQKNQNANGTWPDLDYQDKHPTRWQPKEHLDRMRSMAQVLVTKDHQLYQDAELVKSVDRALDNWIEKRYKCSNWWWNDIGTRQRIRDTIILLDDRLSDERRKSAIETMGNRKITGTGANLLWIAELSLHRACLMENEEDLAEPIEKIWDEIKVGSHEGIQADWSFYQHGARSHAFSYGRSFLDIAASTAWELRGTKWEIPEEKRQIISNFLLEGMQWMSRGTYTPSGTIDRVISRKHGNDAAVLTRVLPRWAEVDPNRRDEIETFLAHQKGAAARPFGFRYFPYAELAAYQRPAGTIFLKVISKRTMPTESINGENQKGVPYLHYGDHYLVRDGKEFTNLPPVFEWNHLPGLTVAEEDSKQERKEFVGGVSDGTSGMTTMDYVRVAEGKPLVSLHKTWFFHDDLMLCLICDRERNDAKKSQDKISLVTSIEQCRLQGTVTAANKANQVSELKIGQHHLSGSRWILHNGFGYFPLDDSPVNVFLGEARGSWSSINTSYDDKPNSVVDSVLRIQLPHDKDKTQSGFGVMIGASQEKLGKIASKSNWKVLQNDRRCQAIRFDDGLTMAAFYEAGSISKDGTKTFEVNQPCVAMWTNENVWLSDPTSKGITVSMEWNGKKQKLELPKNGSSKKIEK